jgi:hypothetical protein
LINALKSGSFLVIFFRYSIFSSIISFYFIQE